uniref:Uncharacterized protein n=1 Tax=Rhizophora mucronata TaxID=61149 RepID=A0A2P2JVE7_RHIMU
METRCLRLDCK